MFADPSHGGANPPHGNSNRPSQDGDIPRIEADGTLSWLPNGGERLAWLELAKPDPHGGWLRTFHAAPAEIWRRGRTFHIRKPKRASTTVAWHTLVVEADPRYADVNVETRDGMGSGAVVTFHRDPTDVQW